MTVLVQDVAGSLGRWLPLKTMRQRRQQLSYPVIRCRDIELMLDRINLRYDHVVLQLDWAHKRINLDRFGGEKRFSAYVRDAKHLPHFDRNSFPNNFGLIANSRFVANKLFESTGREVPTVVPYVEKTRYFADQTGDFVTFVNPVPEKGVDLAIEIARRCPEVPFLFLECWPRSRTEWKRLQRRVSCLENVTLHRMVREMRDVYARTRILIVPSQWEESWARVVTESHFSGIPVIASDVGGLRESVGEGGILIPPSTDADGWATVLREICHCSSLYLELSASAQRQSEMYWAKAARLPSLFMDCLMGNAPRSS